MRTPKLGLPDRPTIAQARAALEAHFGLPWTCKGVRLDDPRRRAPAGAPPRWAGLRDALREYRSRTEADRASISGWGLGIAPAELATAAGHLRNAASGLWRFVHELDRAGAVLGPKALRQLRAGPHWRAVDGIRDGAAAAAQVLEGVATQLRKRRDPPPPPGDNARMAFREAAIRHLPALGVALLEVAAEIEPARSSPLEALERRIAMVVGDGPKRQRSRSPAG